MTEAAARRLPRHRPRRRRRLSRSLRSGIFQDQPAPAEDALPGLYLRALWLHRVPRGHQVELEGLDPAAWPKNVADYPYVLVAAESVVVALRKTSQIDRDGRRAVGRRERHRLAAKVDPKDPAV